MFFHFWHLLSPVTTISSGMMFFTGKTAALTTISIGMIFLIAHVIAKAVRVIATGMALKPTKSSRRAERRLQNNFNPNTQALNSSRSATGTAETTVGPESTLNSSRTDALSTLNSSRTDAMNSSRTDAMTTSRSSDTAMNQNTLSTSRSGTSRTAPFSNSPVTRGETTTTTSTREVPPPAMDSMSLLLFLAPICLMFNCLTL